MDTRVFNVCRVCMIQEKSIPFKPFFDGRYPKYLEWITGLKITEDKRIPTLICSRCAMILNQSFKFRSSVFKANEKYLNLLKNYDPLQSTTMIIEATESAEEDPVGTIKEEDIDEFEIDIHEEDRKRVKFEPEAGIKTSDAKQIEPVTLKIGSSKRSRKESHKTFPCSLCSEKFFNDFEKHEHIRKAHGKRRVRNTKRPTPIGSTEPTEYMCIYCELYFKNKFDMLLHRKRTHEEEESTLCCPHCKKLFPKLALLRSHIKTMHSEKQYQCPTCGLCFANKSFFDLHLKKEKNQKDFVCELCSNSFFSQSQLNMHRKRHSDNKPYQCDVWGCGKSFKTKSCLVKHIRVVHLNEKPFVCEFCGHSFSIRHHLKGHLSRIHMIVEGQNT